MKSDIFIWSCQGVANSNFHRIVKEYLRNFDPNVVVLLEMRVSMA